jgi:Flp pilus assembly protein TadG
LRARRSRDRSRAQSLVEFALVTPLLLLVFAAAADMGRAFHAYLAIENAAKEGALFGSRVPLCDDAGGGTCADPNNVTWRVRNELRDQGIRNPDGTELTPAIACLNGSTPRANLADCLEGDTYQVSLTYPFRPLTPMLTSIVGNIDLTSASRAVVLNLAFDPTPGASIQKYVSPTGAVNAADVIAKCLEPDENDASGFYFSPCLDSSTADPTDKLTLRFEQGATISYRLYLGNSGVQSLSGVTVVDSRGNHGCTIPGTFGIGYSQVCNYSRTAPNVTGAGTTMDYDNSATIDSAQTAPATSSARVSIEKPPPRLRMIKSISSYALGDDGDGTPSFGTNDALTVT